MYTRILSDINQQICFNINVHTELRVPTWNMNGQKIFVFNDTVN